MPPFPVTTCAIALSSRRGIRFFVRYLPLRTFTNATATTTTKDAMPARPPLDLNEAFVLSLLENDPRKKSLIQSLSRFADVHQAWNEVGEHMAVKGYFDPSDPARFNLPATAKSMRGDHHLQAKLRGLWRVMRKRGILEKGDLGFNPESRVLEAKPDVVVVRARGPPSNVELEREADSIMTTRLDK
ncbi:hypothetical protein HK101_011108 [Irineochytrium annulatum]|nr:hypothetical protein HK101_011108 [Irineochytrium annulatum]